MIRCHPEFELCQSEKKSQESRERPFVALRRLDFETLLFRDGASWSRVTSAEQLVQVAERARKELIPADFGRFVSHFCSTHGAGLVRAAGLPLGRIQLAS